MSNLAHKIEFTPRSGLQRTLKYHRHLRWIYKASVAFDGFLWVALVAKIAPGFQNVSLLTALTAIGVVSILPLILFLQTWFTLRRLAFTTVEVFSDRLEMDVAGKKSQLFYRDIKQIKFYHFRNKAGWFKIFTSSGNYKFTVVLERSEYILESIMSFDHSLVSAKELESYRMTAIQVDHNCAFYLSLVPEKKEIVLKYIVIPAIASLALLGAHFLRYHTIDLNLMIVSMLIQILAVSVTHAVMMVLQLRKTRVALEINPNHLVRDLEYERRLVRASGRYQKILFPVFMAICCAIIMFQ